MTRECALFNGLEKLASICGKTAAIEFLIAADMLTHNMKTEQGGDSARIRMGADVVSRNYGLKYRRLLGRLKHFELRDPERLERRGSHCYPIDSLAYVVDQVCKRYGYTEECVFDLLVNLDVSNRRNSVPLYICILTSFRDAVGVFSDDPTSSIVD